MKKLITQNCKGQAIVETALVLMIIVFFTFAITEFGRAMYIKNMLNNAARTGVRQAVVTGTLTVTLAPNPGSPRYPAGSFPYNDLTADAIRTKLSDSLFYVGDKSTVMADLWCSDCTGTTATSGKTITISVTYPFEPFLTLFKNMMSNTLVGQASMRYE